MRFIIKKIDQENHITELSLYNEDGFNILQFKDLKTNEIHTTTWNIDDLVDFLNRSKTILAEEVKFPFDVAGSTLAELDYNARNF